MMPEKNTSIPKTAQAAPRTQKPANSRSPQNTSNHGRSTIIASIATINVHIKIKPQ
jgi:hypothetical protein